jgi:hypothetical protein
VKLSGHVQDRRRALAPVAYRKFRRDIISHHNFDTIAMTEVQPAQTSLATDKSRETATSPAKDTSLETATSTEPDD